MTELATVRVEYTSGLKFTDRVSLDVVTCEIWLQPRLSLAMAAVGEVESSPAFSLEYRGCTVPVHPGPDDSYAVVLPQTESFGFWRVLDPVFFPTKDQSQQNGRFLQTLAAASFVGAVGYAHAATHMDVETVLNTATLIIFGVGS